MQKDKRQRTTRTTRSQHVTTAKKAGGRISFSGSAVHRVKSEVRSPKSEVQDQKTPEFAIRKRFPMYAGPLESLSHHAQSSRGHTSSCVRRCSRRPIRVECGFSGTYACPPYSGQ